MIVDELVNDGSFRVIERKRLDAILAEQNFSNSERADPSAKTMAQLGKVLGVRYLVVGSVTKFGTEQSNKSFSGGGYGSAFGIGSVGTSKGKATSQSPRASSISRVRRSWPAPRATAPRSAAACCSVVAAGAGVATGSASVSSGPLTSATRSSARRPRWPSSRRRPSSSRQRAVSIGHPEFNTSAAQACGLRRFCLYGTRRRACYSWRASPPLARPHAASSVGALFGHWCVVARFGWLRPLLVSKPGPADGEGNSRVLRRVRRSRSGGDAGHESPGRSLQ